MTELGDHTNDDVLIGLAEATELDSILKVMCAAFRMEYTAARPIYFSDPLLDANDKMVVRCADKIASCVTLVSGEVKVDKAIVATCGLAGVATAPGYQRRGFATQLIASSLEEAGRRGAHIALLTASQPAYYERRGWAVVGRNYLLQIDRSNLPLFNSKFRVRPMRLEDADRVDVLFQGRANYSLRCSRTALHWSGLISRLPQSVVVTDIFGDVAGYMLLQTKLGRVNLARAATPPAVHVLETVANCDEARHALVGWLARRVGPDEVHFEMAEPLMRRIGLLGLHNIDLQVSGGCLGYITNFPSMIAALSQNWNSLGSRSISLRCVFHDGRENTVGIRAEREKVLIVPQTSIPSDQPAVQASAHTWAQLATGYCSATDAIATGHLTVVNDELRKDLITMFPPRSPMLAPPDLF